jgi:hypothetical protein
LKIRFDNPAQMPSGIPTSSASRTAASVSESVSMLSCHSPCNPMKVNPAAASSATFQLPKAQARYAATATTPSQPITGTGRPYDGCAITAWSRITI